MKAPFRPDVVRNAARLLGGAGSQPVVNPMPNSAWPQQSIQSCSAAAEGGRSSLRPRRQGPLNYRAVAGFSAFGLAVAGFSLPVFAANHKDDKQTETLVVEVQEVVTVPEELEGAAALAVAPSMVGVSDPIDASRVALSKADELRSYENLVIAMPREDYTRMVRRSKAIEELIRRFEAGSLEPSGKKISSGVEQMVDYAIRNAIRSLDVPHGDTADTPTVLYNALTAQTIRLERAISDGASAVAEWPELNLEVAHQVLIAEAEAAQADAENLRQFEDSVEGFDNGELPEEALCPIDGYISHLLRCDAAAQLNRLNTAFRARFGKDLGVTDTYRSLEEQIALKKAKPVLAGKPGTSNHGWGRAIDVSSNVHWNYATPEHLWMIENAPKFGWHNPTWAAEGGKKEEAWHWEFNGKYAPINEESDYQEPVVVELDPDDVDATDPREEKPSDVDG